MPSKGTTAQRGYGWKHQKLREHWTPTVKTGRAICWRCHQPIHPNQPWDLGHDDNDRTQYRGPEHRHSRHCPAGGNRATRTHQAQRRRNRTPPALAIFNTKRV